MSLEQTVSNLKFAPVAVVQAADKLVQLKKNKDPWTVIEAIIKIWESTHPTEWKSHIIDLEFSKKTAKVTSVGGRQFSNVSKSGGSYLQKKLDIPQRVIYMIRKMYSPEELPMNEDFYYEWARRFPRMVVSEVR